MTAIVFEPLRTTSGDATARLQRMRGSAFDTAPDGVGAGLLPQLTGAAVAQDVGSASGLLPRLRAVAMEVAGAYVAAALPRMLGLATGGAPTPSVALAQGVLPLMQGSSTGTTTSFGDATGTTPRLRTLALELDGFSAPSLRAMVGSSYEFAPPTSFVSLMQSPGFMDIAGVGSPGRIYLDALQIGAAAEADWIMVRQAILALSCSAPAGLLDAVEAIGDQLTFSDVAAFAWSLLFQQGLLLGASAAPNVRMLVEVGEAMALAGSDSSVLDGLEAVLVALRLGAADGYVWPGSVLESVKLGGGGAEALLALDLQQERIALTGNAVGAASFAVLAPESILLVDTASSSAELLSRIADGATLLATINLPDGQYLAWVCNTESKAFTTYRNFPFNSFCELGGHYYGATDEGIYLLEGDDDAGVPIDAHVRGGLADMGTGKLKRMEALYLGYRADGQLLLKVVTTSDGGEKTESWYGLDAQPAQAMREGRIKIGKGLKSVYWGFEVANVNGGDFELDTIAWLPMVLDRRI